MNKENVTLLNDEIKAELEELSKTQLGTDSYKITVDGVTKLMDRAIELEKSREERAKSYALAEAEERLKREQMDDERKDRRVKNGLTAASLLTSLGVTVWGVCKGLKFEETGVVGSGIVRQLLSRVIPKK